MFGKVCGRFFLTPELKITDDGEENTFTLSELVETYELWHTWNPPGRKKLFTMFETSDIHPDIAQSMQHFDEVWVPFPYLRDILLRAGVQNAHSLNWWKSPLVPKIRPQVKTNKGLVFLYVGTNDIRKNVAQLVDCFLKSRRNDDLLILKTNKSDNIPIRKNIKIITNRLSDDELSNLYNDCDYVITFTKGEGVGLPLLEAFDHNKPIIATSAGLLNDTRNFLGPTCNWITLPHEEKIIGVDIINKLPSYLHKVFYGSWFVPKQEEAIEILRNLH